MEVVVYCFLVGSMLIKDEAPSPLWEVVTSEPLLNRIKLKLSIGYS